MYFRYHIFYLLYVALFTPSTSGCTAVVNCGNGVSEMLALAVNIPAELIQWLRDGWRMSIGFGWLLPPASPSNRILLHTPVHWFPLKNASFPLIIFLDCFQSHSLRCDATCNSTSIVLLIYRQVLLSRSNYSTNREEMLNTSLLRLNSMLIKLSSLQSKWSAFSGIMEGRKQSLNNIQSC